MAVDGPPASGRDRVTTFRRHCRRRRGGSIHYFCIGPGRTECTWPRGEDLKSGIPGPPGSFVMDRTAGWKNGARPSITKREARHGELRPHHRVTLVVQKTFPTIHRDAASVLDSHIRGPGDTRNQIGGDDNGHRPGGFGGEGRPAETPAGWGRFYLFAMDATPTLEEDSP